MNPGWKRLAFVAAALWAGYWLYEMVRIERLMADPAAMAMPILANAYEEKWEHAFNMLWIGPVVAVAAYLIGRWVYRGFTS